MLHMRGKQLLNKSPLLHILDQISRESGTAKILKCIRNQWSDGDDISKAPPPDAER